MTSEGPSQSRRPRASTATSTDKKGKSHAGTAGTNPSSSSTSTTFRYLNKNPTAQEWGPAFPAPAKSEAGALKDQNLRAALLTADTSLPFLPLKRRSSLPSTPKTTDHDSNEEETLAFVHNVQPTDTLARVLLIYDIAPTALRKANRLWPNDSIQMRSQLYLPVDDCAVKGVPIPTSNTSLLPSSSDRQFVANGGSLPASYGSSSSHSPLPRTFQTSDGHHSFVRIDPIGPVEIVRLPRPKLSHFPPATNELSTDGASTARLPAPVEANSYDPNNLPEAQLGRFVGEVAKDSFEGLEVVGAAIESFVRRVASNARATWVKKTTGDFIELTSHLNARPTQVEDRNTRRSRTPNRNRSYREDNSQLTSACSNGVSTHSSRSEATARRRMRNQSSSDG
ncbi:hypothetical protein ABW19_dt0200707 [Dactylella cylindrospora]|nr:hypothetical protein ABW19_dt0200707 [Dactylella cylindrospora]